MNAQQPTPKPLSARQIRQRRAKLRRIQARKRAFKRPLAEIQIELGYVQVSRFGGIEGAW